MSRDDIVLEIGRIFTPEKEIEEGSIRIENGRISKIVPGESVSSKEGETELSYPNCIAVPGFIDIHMHGYGGNDASSGKKEDLIKIAKSLPKHGVATFLPSTISEMREKLREVCESFRELVEEGYDGAEMPGLHLEGPHFGTGEERGAQNPDLLRDPDVDELEEMIKASGGNVKRVTLAPELSGALEYVKMAKKLGAVVAAGHTNASYEKAVEAFDAGVSIVNHLYNGMRKFHHREPGIIGATLTRNDVYAEMITDMIHVHPGAINMAIRAKGIDNSILITDSISAAGLPEGEYELGGQEITVKDGTSRIKDSGRLAGSTLTMDRAVKNVVKKLDLNIKEALKMATVNPANVLSLTNRGRIRKGYLGNIAILTEEYEVKSTIIGGKIF